MYSNFWKLPAGNENNQCCSVCPEHHLLGRKGAKIATTMNGSCPGSWGGGAQQRWEHSAGSVAVVSGGAPSDTTSTVSGGWGGCGANTDQGLVTTCSCHQQCHRWPVGIADHPQTPPVVSAVG